MIKRYKIIISVATFTDISTLPDDIKKFGTEIFVEDEQAVYSYNPITKSFSIPIGSSGFKFPRTAAVFNDSHLNKIIGIDTVTNLAVPYAVVPVYTPGSQAGVSFSLETWDLGDELEINDSVSSTAFPIIADTQVPANLDLDAAATAIVAYIETLEDPETQDTIWNSSFVTGTPQAKATSTTSISGSSPGTGFLIHIQLNGSIDITTFISSNTGGSLSQFVLNDVIPALEAIGYEVNSNNYPEIVITAPDFGPTLNGSFLTIEAHPGTQATTNLLFNGSYPDGGSQFVIVSDNIGPLFQLGPVTYGTFDEFLDVVIDEFETLGYGVVDNRPGENSLTLTRPGDDGENGNGITINVRDENDSGGSHYLDGNVTSVPFSGGVTDPEFVFITTNQFTGGANEVKPLITVEYILNSEATGDIVDENDIVLGTFSGGASDVFDHWIRNMPILGKLLLFDDDFVYISKEAQMDIEAGENLELTAGASNKTIVAVDGNGEIVEWDPSDIGWKAGFLLADALAGEQAKILFIPS